MGTLHDHYQALYRDDLDPEAEWLEIGARHKADSIQQMLMAVGGRPASVLELGAGTGAVIRELKRRGVGLTHTAVDYSEDALGYLRGHCPEIRTICADITDPLWSFGGRYDLVVLSHVLEHLADPAAVLATVVRTLTWTHLAIEVPLEDLLASRMKLLVRSRANNAAGHVQFYAGRTFRRLVESCSLRIVASRRYLPVQSLSDVHFVCNKNRLSRARRLIQALTGRYLPLVFGPVWGEIYYAHAAVLCVMAPRGPRP